MYLYLRCSCDASLFEIHRRATSTAHPLLPCILGASASLASMFAGDQRALAQIARTSCTVIIYG